MLFSGSVFLFAFLPIVLIVYYGPLRGRRRGQNVFLLLASLFFYAWGEPWFVLIMLGAIAANYGFGLWVAAWQARGKPVKIPLIVTVAANMGLLFIFKYLGFTMSILRGVGLPVPVPVFGLPVGISFFTFQAISYVVDIARGRCAAQRDILKVGLYISLFPQLVAGPIVKYETIADEIDNRRETWADVSRGSYRFILGLGKKVLISNQLAMVADAAFGALNGLSMSFAWLGAMCYFLQLYFDFSGYSDMAIGLGQMLGFHFPENFNYPLTADSVAEFWRRWHISLTSWFRDYVYIPLGGSRAANKWLVVRNYLVVWMLTGVWHGANWTFIVWGMVNFGLFMWERYGGLGNSLPRWARHAYTVAAMTLAFVVFRAPDIGTAAGYLMAMLKLDTPFFWQVETGYYLREYGVFLLAGILCVMPTATWLRARLARVSNRLARIWEGTGAIATLLVFVVATAFLIKGTYNPFIYFNF